MISPASQLKKLTIKLRNLVYWLINYQLFPGMYFREIYRVRTFHRHTPGVGQFQGKSFHFADGVGFVGNVKELFSDNCYYFETKKESPLIIDCGAYMGLSVYYFKTLFPKARIIAFEAEPKLFEVLSKNIAAHNLEDVQAYNRAVWDEDTELVFYAGNSMSSSLIFDVGEKGTPVRVKTIRLKEFLQQPVDLLKIDIEGAEVQVIKDIRDDLNLVERVFIEYHSIVGKEQALGELLDILTKAGFRYYIQHAKDYAKRPFTGLAQEGFDLQLNIFAMR